MSTLSKSFPMRDCRRRCADHAVRALVCLCQVTGTFWKPPHYPSQEGMSIPVCVCPARTLVDLPISSTLQLKKILFLKTTPQARETAQGKGLSQA